MPPIVDEYRHEAQSHGLRRVAAPTSLVARMILVAASRASGQPRVAQ
jgi:hypothetical protein